MPGRVVDRLERDHQLHRRAVRVGDQALVAVERLRVDLGDDERDSGSRRHARRVVDDDGAGVDEARRPLAATSSPPAREEREVEALDRLVGERAGTVDAVELAAGRALGGERDDLARGEAALAQLARA